MNVVKCFPFIDRAFPDNKVQDTHITHLQCATRKTNRNIVITCIIVVSNSTVCSLINFPHLMVSTNGLPYIYT